MREIDKFCKGVEIFSEALPVLMERFILVWQNCGILFTFAW